MSEAFNALMEKHAATTQGEWRYRGPASLGGPCVSATVDRGGLNLERFILSCHTRAFWYGSPKMFENFDPEANANAGFIAAAHNTLPTIAQDFAALRAERDAAVKRAEACEALANHYRKSLDRVAYEMDNVPDDLREELREECRLEDAAIAAGCQLELDGDA